MKTARTLYLKVSDGNHVLTPKEFLNYAGPLLTIKVTNLLTGKTKEGNGLIDTGSTKSCLDPSTIADLKINPSVDKVTVNSAVDGQNEQLSYSNYGIEIPALGLSQEITGANMAHTIDILPHPHEVIGIIGRDILDSCILHYDGLNSSVDLAH